MKKPNLTEGEWKAQSLCIVSEQEDVTICDCNVDSYIEVDNQIANQSAISSVPDMIDALIEAKVEIEWLDKAYKHSRVWQKIEQALEKAGVTEL